LVASVNTVSFLGLESNLIDVQVHFSSGLPSFKIVGLPDKTVNESKERVRSALSSMGLSFPAKRITVNLSPADSLKEGTHYDLPIAIGLLIEMEILPKEELLGYLVLGELSLDGKIVAVNGILPASMFANQMDLGIIIPKENYLEAKLSGLKNILPTQDLLQIINHFKGSQIVIEEREVNIVPPKYPDLKEIKGQEEAKRALEICASGNHNMLMVGPPGSGKSMLAERLPGILPELEVKEILEVMVINSIAGNLRENNIRGGINFARPFRSPHHNCSMPALVGGGSKAKPGEITLAHRGVLFLDELAEFSTQTLDSLRQPIETKKVTVARVQSHITYPANFQLVSAMNPCKCGYLGANDKECSRAPKCGQEYQSKISGPLLDRFDIFFEIPHLSTKEILSAKEGEDSAQIRNRVLKTRLIQKERYKNEGIYTNNEMNNELIAKFCLLEKPAEDYLDKALDKLKLSMRGYNRVLKLARTIADIDQSDIINKEHIAESLGYRRMNY
jgi:magnesium chelatase family protein